MAHHPPPDAVSSPFHLAVLTALYRLQRDHPLVGGFGPIDIMPLVKPGRTSHLASDYDELLDAIAALRDGELLDIVKINHAPRMRLTGAGVLRLQEAASQQQLLSPVTDTTLPAPSEQEPRPTHEVQCRRIRLKPGALPTIREWAAELQARRDEALATMREEGVWIEATFLEQGEEADFLIVFMKAENMARAREVGAKSTHPIDRYHRTVRAETVESSQQLELLLDLDREMER